MKTENAFLSKVLDQDITYYHLHFKGEAPEKRDVLFVQDGLNYLELGDFERILQTAIQETGFQGQLDIYMIHPGDSWQRYHFYHQDDPQQLTFLSFFHHEFYPSIIKQHQDLHKIGALGDSLGGLVNVALAAKQPERFTHLLLQSTAYEPAKLLNEMTPKQVQHWNVYQVVGLKEDQFVSPLTGNTLQNLTENRKLLQRFHQLEVETNYHEEDEEHSWDFWRCDLPRALTYFFTK